LYILKFFASSHLRLTQTVLDSTNLQTVCTETLAHSQLRENDLL
jgi:hypothetical protein